jgi:hypothetical protein
LKRRKIGRGLSWNIGNRRKEYGEDWKDERGDEESIRYNT